MQLNLTINHTFEDPVSFAEFAAKFRAVFADLFKVEQPAASILTAPPNGPYSALPPSPPVVVMPVAGSFGGGNGGVSAPQEIATPSGAIAANPESHYALDLTANNTAPEAVATGKRTRRTKAEMEADRAARAAPTTTAAPVAAAPALASFFDVPSAAPAAKPAGASMASQATLDDVRSAVSDLIMQDGGEVKLADFMRSNGWKKTGEIPADRYNEVVTKLTALKRS